MFLNLIVFTLGLFAFIASMIGTLCVFFGKRWRLFVIMLLCVLVSSACMFFELYRLLILSQPHQTPIIFHQPYYNPL